MLLGLGTRAATAVSFGASVALAALSFSGSVTWSHQYNVVFLAQCAFLGARGGDVLSLDGAKEFQQLIPGADFSLVPKAGHSVMGDNPPGFEAAVREFYQKKGYLSA